MIIVGYRLNAKEPAAKALERILGLAPDAARKLARSFPALVRQALAQPDAELIAARLRDAGALVELRETAGAGPTRKRTSTPLPPPSPVAAQAARQRAIPTPRPAAGPTPEPSSDTAAYRLGDFGLGPPPAAARPAAAATAPAAPAAASAAVARAPNEDLSFDLDLSSGPLLELEQAPVNTNARAPATYASEPPGFDARFETTADAAPPPAVEERALRAIHRTPRAAAEPVRRSVTPRRPRLGARLRAGAQGWLPSLVLLGLLGAGTLCAVGFALDPDDPFALLRAPSGAVSDAGAAAEVDGRHPLLRAAPAVARPPLAAILRARIAGVHVLPTSFSTPGGKSVDCALVEQGEHEDARTRLSELRRTGSEVAVPREAQAMLSEHARALRATGGETLRLTPLCLTL